MENFMRGGGVEKSHLANQTVGKVSMTSLKETDKKMTDIFLVI